MVAMALKCAFKSEIKTLGEVLIYKDRKLDKGFRVHCHFVEEGC